MEYQVSLTLLFLSMLYAGFQVKYCSSSLPSSSQNSTRLCHSKQSLALLQFKNSISSVNLHDPVFCAYPKTNSWIKDSDCCSWEGVTCDKVTGNVIGLDLDSSCLTGTIKNNSNLFQLSHLRWLNLAYNNFYGSQISSQFRGFRELKLLNLSTSGFSGPISSEISHLSNLVLLDLSSPSVGRLQFEQRVFMLFTGNLTRLRVLNLDWLDMSLVEPVSLLNLSSSIRTLSLCYCDIRGEIPDDFFRFPNLQKIYLDQNLNLTGYLPKSNWSSPLQLLQLSMTSFKGEIPDSIASLQFLKVIEFSSCHFIGSIPASIGNLTQLAKLDLSSNNLTGHVPSSLKKLKQLTSLDLSSNILAGEIPDIFGELSQLIDLSLSNNKLCGRLPLSLFTLNQLSAINFSSNHLTGPLPDHVRGFSNLFSLDLSDNFLSGRVPSWLFTLPSLYSLNIANNKLTGPIEQFNLPNSLFEVYLRNNKIKGSIPSSFFELVNLTYLDFSSNNLSGTVEFGMLSKLENLESLDLSHNNQLSFGSDSVSYTLPYLESLIFSFCNISKFPNFLRTLRKLKTLDLSYNKIHGRISKSESEGWESLASLNLSHNFLTYIEHHPWQKIAILDLQNNLLQGSLVVPPPSTFVLLVSNNNLTEQIPRTICNLRELDVLSLSNNTLQGKIPPCLGNFSKSLFMLHLQRNNLHGSIPDTFNSSGLTSLDLSYNKLEGPLPRSLANCYFLEVINVRNNEISDAFPYWLGTVPDLKVLVLRSNRFYGPINVDRSPSPFSSLQILDLSHNKFTGCLPRTFFGSLEGMMNIDGYKSAGMQYMEEDNYQESVTLTIKGMEIEMERILTIFTFMDLSKNLFQGRIPEVLGTFKSLLVLNLSHNSLTGNIPSSLGNLRALESLDLSTNKLDGEIPEQLRSLTFLAVLNLSHNQLHGPIPQGNQFATYGSDSFIGNIGLCGEPLPKECSNNKTPESDPSILPEEDDDGASEFNWKITMMGYGCGIVIGLSIGSIAFSTGKPLWFVRMVEGGLQKKVRRLGQRRRR